MTAQSGSGAQSRTHQLGIKARFDGLSHQERLYAHHMSRAAWHGTRIVLRQTSPESIGIFELILKLYSRCDGEWLRFREQAGVTAEDMASFVEYAATFLSNIGNYYGSGDQKFTPKLSRHSFSRLAAGTPELEEQFRQVADLMYSPTPSSLGFPGKLTQSAYYPGPEVITEDEIEAVSKALEERSIYPENVRIHKEIVDDRPVFSVLQASVDIQEGAIEDFKLSTSQAKIQIVRGDHSAELTSICLSLSNALTYCANETQRTLLSEYIDSFQTGSLHAYRDSQKTWIKDTNPRVENIFGFVEPYRDPHGTKAEFESLVAISDPEQTRILANIVQKSATFIQRLPWATGIPTDNGGKGPFEKSLFEPPELSSIHALAYCSSIIFPEINLPNYNDIRQDHGFKNVIIANRMSAESREGEVCPLIKPLEVDVFQRHKYQAYYWWVVLHELVGHGTGRMMIENAEGEFNFDIHNPPVDPLTGNPIRSWYRPGQTWTGQFGDLATTVDECRAELVGAYLMDDQDLLGLLGFTNNSEITNDQITYNLYLQLGVDGLRGLENFNVEDGRWGQAHSRAHFAILKCLLRDGDGFMRIECDEADEKLHVIVDRARIISHGKPALGGMLLRLHMYRSTADVKACRAYYDDLSKVEEEQLIWRRLVMAKKPPKWVFVQANTFLDGDEVLLKEYTPTHEGVIQSWAERGLL